MRLSRIPAAVPAAPRVVLPLPALPVKGLAAAFLVLFGASGAFAQHSHGTHEHGTATLRVAAEAGILHIELESPLDNLVGFEHPPRNEEQRRAVAEAEGALTRFERVFSLPAAAACTVADVVLTSPWPRDEPPHSSHTHGEAHEKGRKDAHGHAGEEAHAEVRVTYELRCASPGELRALEVKLFDAFPRIQRIRTETVTPRGQGSSTLSKTDQTLPL